MNNFNLNFVLLQTTSKSIIVVEDLDLFLTEKWMVTGGVSGRSGRGWETPNTHLFLKNKNKILVYLFFKFFFHFFHFII
jgi:hypothetical protein